MSKWHPKLWEDIYDRLQADTGSGGLFASGATLVNSLTNVFVPQATSMPYVYFQSTADTTEEAFDAKAFDVTIDLHTFHEAEPAGGGDPLSTCSMILDRIEGNWLDTNDGTPAHGLDRYTPPLSGTDWTASPIVHTGTTEQHEVGVLHFIQTFETLVSRLATSVQTP